MKQAALISVVDDDLSIRESLEDLFQSVGYRVQSFPSAEDYLESRNREELQCLILDVRLGGMSGLELQRQLNTSHETSPPIIFITAHGDEATRSLVKEQGAVECLIKPYNDDDLLDAVENALSGGKSG